jgi:hypothetical protein
VQIAQGGSHRYGVALYSKQGLINQVTAMSNAVGNEATLAAAMRVRRHGAARVQVERP